MYGVDIKVWVLKLGVSWFGLLLENMGKCKSIKKTFSILGLRNRVEWSMKLDDVWVKNL